MESVKPYTFSDKLFGDKIVIALYEAEDSLAEMIIGEVYEEALRLQKIFNFYDDKSELSKLNAKRKLKCSKELLEVLKKALKASELTNGLYDVSLGSLFLARKKGIKEKFPNCSYKDIEIIDHQVRLLNDEVQIDLGSIAKGYIVDKITNFLKEQGLSSGFVDGRGDIIVFGENPQTISIEHPRKKGESIESLQIKNSGIATSGDYNQFNKDFENSHIINNNLSSVTVIANTLEEADLLATMIAVVDEDKIKELSRRPGVKKIIIYDKEMNRKVYE